LQSADKISFHPNENTATLVLSFESFLRFLDWSGNTYEFIKLYDTD
jgi:Ala-tRNA(Pro) deacylase